MTFQRFTPFSHKWPRSMRSYAIQMSQDGGRNWTWMPNQPLYTSSVLAERIARNRRDECEGFRYRVKLLLLGKTMKLFAEKGRYKRKVPK